VFGERVGEIADDFVIPVHGVLAIFENGFAGDGDGVVVQEFVFGKGFDNRGETACVVEIFHEEAAGGHEIDEGGDGMAEAVPVVERKWHADAAGDGEEMDYGVGGTAESAVEANGVFEIFALKNFGDADVFANHFDDAASGHLREDGAAGIDGGNGAVERER